MNHSSANGRLGEPSLPKKLAASRAYFFDAFGLALARFSFRTEGLVARGLTGDLAR